MKKKKVYIFNGTSRAAVYGIGTYIDQLTNCLKKTDIDFEVVHLYSEGKEVTVIEKDGYKQISIPAVGSYNTRSSRYYSSTVAYLLREYIPDDKNTQYIFHLNFMTNSYLVTSLRRLFKCKIILVAHYTSWSFSLLGDYEKLKTIISKNTRKLDKEEKQIRKSISEDKKMINQCDRFVCVAQHTLDSFIDSCNIDATKSFVINNALEDAYIELSDKEKQTVKKKYHIPEATQIILFAGRLDEVKGISSLIKAFKKVLANNPNAHLFIAGEGDFNRWLAEAKDCWARITFTGRLDKKQLYEFYQIANIGIVSSIHEEFGLVAIEMMMHQLPIIVTNTSGLSEIVEDNISGLKVPINIVEDKRVIDENILANKIMFLLDNLSYAHELGFNGRKKFLEKYEITTFKEKMLNLYHNI